MAKKKKNNLIRIFIEGDQVYIKQKAKMTKREMNILVGAFQEIVNFAKEKPKIRKGKLWLN